MFCIAKEGDLMLPEELRELAAKVRAQRAEAQFLEVKAAKDGCPKRLYDTLSGFSNQDSGGILISVLMRERHSGRWAYMICMICRRR